MLLCSRELGLRDVFNDKAGVARTTDFWPATNTGRRVRAQTKETTQPKSTFGYLREPPWGRTAQLSAKAEGQLSFATESNTDKVSDPEQFGIKGNLRIL